MAVVGTVVVGAAVVGDVVVGDAVGDWVTTCWEVVIVGG
jgi:hypothetical protein